MNVAAILKEKGREVFTTTPDTTLLDIATLLGTRRIGCIVVTGIDGKVIGIVSERDIVREIARAGAKILKEPVASCMTKSVVSCREADTIEKAKRLVHIGRRITPRPALPETSIAEPAREHVLHHGEALDQRELLKDHTHAPARPPQRAAGERSDVLAVEDDLA